MSRYSIEFLPNGMVSILHRPSGLRGLFHRNGSHRSGDLHLRAEFVRELIG